MKRAASVLGCELRNVMRSKWIYAYSLILAAFVTGFFYLVNDLRKTELALVNALLPLVPLVSILFTTTYWYTSERFTELLLAQPVSRRCLFWSRITALVGSLALSSLVGLVIPAFCFGAHDSVLLWLFLATVSVGAVFCLFGSLVATGIADRMWGIGLGFAVWFYYVALHDALILLVLYWFRDYSLQRISALLCALNPLSLTRVMLLIRFDAPLLLGHSGAIVRRAVESGEGYMFGFGAMALWLGVPSLAAYWIFRRRDF